MKQVHWGYEVSPRGPYEFGLMTEPVYATWVIVASGDRAFIRSQRGLIESVLMHYDWSRLYTVPFVIVETIYHTALQVFGRKRKWSFPRQPAPWVSRG